MTTKTPNTPQKELHRPRWYVTEVDLPTRDAMVQATGLPSAVAEMLLRRGIGSVKAAEAFLKPDFAQLHDPYRMLGMPEAVRRVRQAVLAREPVLIYGDYDVDGTTATVLLKTAIDRITPRLAEAGSLVRFHIPHRIREGYGMQTAVLAGAAEAGIRLVISVDTGIRAFAAADEAEAQGMDLIVTDHHLPDHAGVPKAIAVVNPNGPGCEYPFKELCGAAVAFKLAHALLLSVIADPEGFQPIDEEALRTKFLPSFLKLLSIATIADSVSLTSENRVITALGLEELRKPAQYGLRALMRLAEISFEEGAEPFTARDIAFRIAPRINAAGRMDTASDVVNLFLTRDREEAERLAEKLHTLNAERREAEARVLAIIETQLAAMRDEDPELATHGVVVVDGEGWHRGVVGILASRVLERTGRPALVLTHEDGSAHGSGRSIDGFHLLDALTAIHAEDGALFDRFGGHAHAVGFALPSSKVAALRERLAAYSIPRITPELQRPDRICDAELTLSQIDKVLLDAVRRCQPFGMGNEEPTFLSRNLTVVGSVRALKEKHAKFELRDGASSTITCICWSRGESWPERLAALGVVEGALVDVRYRLRGNTFRGVEAVEMELCEIRLAAPELS